MAGMILHAGYALDDHGHPRQRQQRRRESERPGASAQGRLDSAQFSGTQPRLAAGASGPAQSGASVLPPRVVPPHDTLPADPEPTRNRSLRVLARCEQPCRLQPTIFQRLEIASRNHMAGHVSMLRSPPAQNVTILCETQ